METRDIIELRKSATGEKFYPQSHIDGTVGNETIAYLGDVVGESDDDTTPTPSPTPTPSGEKKLSVSQRRGVIVGRAIPFHPRKGKKYYFADGFIKVKTRGTIEGQMIISIYTWSIDNGIEYDSDIKSCSSWNKHNDFGSNQIIVEIMNESPKDDFVLNNDNVSIYKLKGDYQQTESPFIDIIDGKVCVTGTPIQRHVHRTNDKREPISFSPHSTIAFAYRKRTPNNIRGSHPKKPHTYGYRRIWLGRPKYHKLPESVTSGSLKSFRGLVHVFSVRRGRRSQNYCTVWQGQRDSRGDYKECRI